MLILNKTDLFDLSQKPFGYQLQDHTLNDENQISSVNNLLERKVSSQQMHVSHICYCTCVPCLLIAVIKKQCHFCWETSYSRRNAFDCNYAAVRQ